MLPAGANRKVVPGPEGLVGMGEGEAFLGLDGQVLVLPDQVTAAEIHWIAPGKLGPGSHRITKVKSFLVLYGFRIHGKGQEAPILHGVVSRALGGGGQGLNGDEVGAAFQAFHCAILGDDGAIPKEVVVDEALTLAAGFSSSSDFPGLVFLFSLDGEGRQEEVLRHKLQVVELPAGVHFIRFGKVGFVKSLFWLFFLGSSRLFWTAFICIFRGRGYRLLWCCGFVRIICILSIIGGGIFRFRRSDRFSRFVCIAAILRGGGVVGVIRRCLLWGRGISAALNRVGILFRDRLPIGGGCILGSKGNFPVCGIGGQGAAVRILTGWLGGIVRIVIFRRSGVRLRFGAFFRSRIRDFLRLRIGGLVGFRGLFRGRGVGPRLFVRGFLRVFFRSFGFGIFRGLYWIFRVFLIFPG